MKRIRNIKRESFMKQIDKVKSCDYKQLIKILAILIVIWLAIPSFTCYNMGVLTEADEVIVYDVAGRELARTDKPMELIGDFYFGEGQVGVWTPSWWDMPFRFAMKVLYRLEFTQNGKLIRVIEVLGGRTERSQARIDNFTFSLRLATNSQKVVLYSNRKFFSFGIEFFNNLSILIEEV